MSAFFPEGISIPLQVHHISFELIPPLETIFIEFLCPVAYALEMPGPTSPPPPGTSVRGAQTQYFVCLIP